MIALMTAPGTTEQARNSAPGFLNDDVDEDDDADEYAIGGHRTAAFERQYLDEHSWEAVKEDEHGRLIAVQRHDVKRKRARDDDAGRRVRRGLIRYMHLVLDMSETCAAAVDMAPNRAAALVKIAERFVGEFFDQNPLSQLGVSVLRFGRVATLSELSASPDTHKRALRKVIQTGGEVSLENMLRHVCQSANFVPPYGHREALLLLSSLTTCDPGSIVDAMKAAKTARVRVSMIGLSAEMYICHRIASETGGRYQVALSEPHLRDLVLAACTPPAVHSSALRASLVRMGFPSKDPGGARFAAFVGEDAEVAGGAFTCPECKAKNAAVPTECHVCGITLILPPHLARSFHHLFPVAAFVEVPLRDLSREDACGACGALLRRDAPEARLLEAATSAHRCEKCSGLYCHLCDAFIHEHLHNCPGCEALPVSGAS